MLKRLVIGLGLLRRLAARDFFGGAGDEGFYHRRGKGVCVQFAITVKPLTGKDACLIGGGVIIGGVPIKPQNRHLRPARFQADNISRGKGHGVGFLCLIKGVGGYSLANYVPAHMRSRRLVIFNLYPLVTSRRFLISFAA